MLVYVRKIILSKYIPFEHVPLVSISCDETIDLDFLRLADSVASCLRLDVILRIPIGIVDDYGIGRSQVDTQTSCSGTQQEYESKWK